MSLCSNLATLYYVIKHNRYKELTLADSIIALVSYVKDPNMPTKVVKANNKDNSIFKGLN